MGKIRIFFAGSMSVGSEEKELYRELIEDLKGKFDLVSDHVGFGDEKENLDDNGMYQKDVRLISDAALLIAEVSTPSSGVGYEVATAVNMGKPVLCLYREGSKSRLSPMISGNPRAKVLRYKNKEELKRDIEDAARKLFAN